ncbi:hypothetical protein R4Z10_14200 [Niallia sp. XMNu-256]|uniref:hypothetical protein n=1 Tax=Niallia sp. XMNu-256 TaxID=3082444 RepID=UPI0030CBF1E4
MKSIQDSLYNWLTIKVVFDDRPEDIAASETEEMFRNLLQQEHGIANMIINHDEDFYYITYTHAEKDSQVRFPRELIEVMLNQINENPDRYKIYPK